MLLLQALLQSLSVYAASPVRDRFPSFDDLEETAARLPARRALAPPLAQGAGSDRRAGQPGRRIVQLAHEAFDREAPGPGGGRRAPRPEHSSLFRGNISSLVRQASAAYRGECAAQEGRLVLELSRELSGDGHRQGRRPGLGKKRGGGRS